MKATDFLKEDHVLIERALCLLERALEKVERGEAPDAELLVRLARFFEEFADHIHHRKEEDILFPALEDCGVPREGGPIGVMLMEHGQGRSLVAQLGRGSRQEIVAAGKAYLLLLRQHMHKENNVLFAMTDQLLPPDSQEALRVRFEEAEEERLDERVRAERLISELERNHEPA